MEILKLIGVVVVIIGLVLKLDTLATVVVAGLLTGLVAGMSPLEILTILGNSFLGNRLATLFVLTLPVIGICEKYGLKDKAIDFIKSIKNITAGKIISLYQFIRALAATFSLRLNGHPQFVRPLINPMVQGTLIAKYGSVDDKTEDDIKSLCAASENFGNFFGQNCFMGAPSTLLIVSTLSEQGIDVDALNISLWSIPIAIISIIVGTAYNMFYDKKISSRYMNKSGGNI